MFYFSHDYSSRNDKKLVTCLMNHGLEAIGAYWCIVEMLYEEGGYLPLSDFDRIIFELRTDTGLIKFLINDSNLFNHDDEKFWSESALKRLKLRSEKCEMARQNADLRWNKTSNANALPTHCQRNANKEKKSKENKYKIKNKKSPEGVSISGFTIPFVEDIRAYCLEKKSNISADVFFNFYESKGWMVGKNKMKDWKASFRNWETRNIPPSTDSQSISQPEINTPPEWTK